MADAYGDDSDGWHGLQWNRAYSARMAATSRRSPLPSSSFNGTVHTQHGWRAEKSPAILPLLASMGPCILSTDGLERHPKTLMLAGLQWNRAYSARMARRPATPPRCPAASMGPCILSTDGDFESHAFQPPVSASMGPCILSTDGASGGDPAAELAVVLQWDRAYSARMAINRTSHNEGQVLLQWDRAYSARMAAMSAASTKRRRGFNGTVHTQHGWRDLEERT